jgi:prephenate dehydrogenase
VTDTQPPFATVTIAGVGLIGGSIALALREKWPSVRIIGVDRPAVLAHAMGSNAIDRTASDLAAAAAADLIILAAPVAHNLQLLREVAPLVPPSTVVTDVCGTKRDIVAAATALATRVSFVGGHPIGGAERGGFGFARPNLFVGRPWLFTPGENQHTDVLDRLFALVRGFGAEPMTIEASTHDRLMAYFSHLPQLTATALMRVTGGGASEEGLTLSGRGLLDTTRLASSPASVWREICASNADFIAGALDEMIATLQTLRADLENGDALEDVFTDAARWRAELLKKQH